VLLLLLLRSSAPRLDGPLWVLRHDVAAANGLAALQLPGETPAAASEQQQVLGQAQQQQQRSFDWFMYDCPAQQLQARCSERQEAAVGKAATFFASENMLPQAHGTPEVGSRGLPWWWCVLPVHSCRHP
jgi:hypothetical protein